KPDVESRTLAGAARAAGDEVQGFAVDAEPRIGLDAFVCRNRGGRGRRPALGQAAAPHQLPSGKVAVTANEPEIVGAWIDGGMRFPRGAGYARHVPAHDVA